MPKLKLKKQEIWAVTVVKNEVDVLPLVITHLFEQGVDYIIVADNMSDDGTFEFLKKISQTNPRLIVAKDVNPVHAQSEKITYLANIAWQRGARWILPFDADEFWYAKSNSLKYFFENSDDYVIYAGFHHAVPTSDSPKDLINTELVMDTADSFPGKVAFRSHPLAVVGPGNHYVCRLGSTYRGLDIVHVQYRGIKQIERKFSQGLKSAQLTGEDLNWFAPHWEAGAKLNQKELQDVWRNISSGLPDKRIQYKAEGPMKTGKFLLWKTWELNNELEKHNDQS